MRRLLCLLAAAALAAVPALAGEEAEGVRNEAIEILEKADAEIKKIDSVRFDAEVSAEGMAVMFLGSAAAEGTVILSGWNGQMPERFWVEYRSAASGDGAAVHTTGAGNGETFYVIDHVNKKAYQDMDPAVMGSTGNRMRGVAMLEYVHDTPFDQEIAGETVELDGVETVNGEECYKIHVVYAGGQGEAWWYFSKNDYLPRKRSMKFESPQGSGGFEQTVSNVQPNYTVEASLFELELPEGYEQVDDFAP